MEITGEGLFRDAALGKMCNLAANCQTLLNLLNHMLLQTMTAWKELGREPFFGLG